MSASWPNAETMPMRGVHSVRQACLADHAIDALNDLPIHVVRRERRRAAASADASIDLRRMLDERSRRARAHPLSAGGGNRLGGAELSIQAMTA
jgi:hypothetical protein